jgi:hypothetical protein
MNTEPKTHTEKDPALEADIQTWLAQHPGLTKEQLLKHMQREAEAEQASRAPFPGPLRQAYASQPRTVLGYTLQPVSLSLIAILEQIKSPFIAMVDIISANHGKTSEEIAQAIDSKLKVTTAQIIETIYCFVTDIETVESEQKNGTLSKAASKEIGRKHHPAQLGPISEAILMHYVASFSTVVDYRAKKAEGDAQSFPSAPEGQATGSAGA